MRTLLGFRFMIRRFFAGIVAPLAIACGGIGTPPLLGDDPTPPSASHSAADDATSGDGGSQAVSYQIGPAHAGAQPNDRLTIPLAERWRHDFHEYPSYALVAGGRAFVASSAGRSDHGGAAHVTALDARTGVVLWGPTVVSDSFAFATTAYEAGSVFVVDMRGHVRALDAATGATRWEVTLPGEDYSYTSPPSALGGTLYALGAAGNERTLYAIDASTGRARGTRFAVGSGESALAVAWSGVFVSSACNELLAFGRSTLDQLWLLPRPAECSPRGSLSLSVYGDDLYLGDEGGGFVLRAADGIGIGAHASERIPAFVGTTMLTTSAGTLAALPMRGGEAQWTFGTAAEPVVLPPISVGPHVVAVTSSRVVILSKDDGSEVSAQPLVHLAPPIGPLPSEPAGLAAAGGMLFVPTGTEMIVY